MARSKDIAPDRWPPQNVLVSTSKNKIPKKAEPKRPIVPDHGAHVDPHVRRIRQVMMSKTKQDEK